MAVDRQLGTDLSVAVLELLKATHRLRQVGPRLHPTVARPAAQILLAIADGPARVTEIAERVQLTPSVASRRVTALIDIGLATRRTDPTDGRAVIVDVTESGRHEIKEILAARGQWYAQLLADWPDDDVRSLGELLHRLSSALLDHCAAETEEATDGQP